MAQDVAEVAPDHRTRQTWLEPGDDELIVYLNRAADVFIGDDGGDARSGADRNACQIGAQTITNRRIDGMAAATGDEAADRHIAGKQCSAALRIAGAVGNR